MSLFTTDDEGSIFVTTDAPAGATYRNGLPFRSDGYLHVNANAPQKFENGFAKTLNGAVCIAFDPIAYWLNGLPRTANGALKCQVDQNPVLTDPYVAGVRLGPLGGIYVNTGGTPPPSYTTVAITNATTTDANHIQLTFAEAVNMPNISGWIFNKNAVAYNAASVSGSGTVWTFAFADPIVFGDTLTVAYTEGNATVVVSTGNGLATIASTPVTNAVPEPFSPTMLFASGEQGVWYDPSDFSTMFQDTAGTVPVTAVGQTVARINDKSGNGNHATQVNASKRPVLQSDGTHFYLVFDGVDDSLATPASVDLSASDKLLICAGVRKLSDGRLNVLESSASADTNNNSFYFAFPNDSNPRPRWQTRESSLTASRYYTDVLGNVVAVFSCTADYALSAALQLDFRKNGARIYTAGDQRTFSQPFGNYPLYISARNSNQYFFNGYIYSLIIRGSAFTMTEITDTETWVNGKTGAY